MSINVNSITPPPSVPSQVVTSILALNNENATKSAVLDSTGALLAYRTIIRSYGELNVNSNAIATVISAANTYYTFNSSSIALNSLSLNFVVGGTSKLVYNGTLPCVFKLNANCNILCAGSNNQTSACFLAINGTQIPQSKSTSYLINNGTHHGSLSAIVSLNQNDYVELQITNATSANNLTVVDYCLSVISLH